MTARRLVLCAFVGAASTCRNSRGPGPT